MTPTPTSDWIDDFDERFRPIDFCNEGENKMVYVEQTRDDIKSFIRHTLLTQVSACRHAILDKLAKGIEGMKFSDEADRDWLQEWIQGNL